MVGGCYRHYMAIRTRIRGAKLAKTAIAATYSVTPGGFNFPNYVAFNMPAGSGSTDSWFLDGSDSRASITDETGRIGLENDVSNEKFVKANAPWPVCKVKYTNKASPFGTYELRIPGSNAPVALDGQYENHISISSGAAIARARVPNTTPELTSGLNSLYELKDLKQTLDLIPAHLLWAVARRKRADSVRELDKWISSVRKTARDPVSAMQAIVGIDLMWKFGIKPLIGDIQKTHSLLGSLDKKLNDIINLKVRLRGRFQSPKTKQVFVYSSGEYLGGTYMRCNSNVTTTKETQGTWVFGITKQVNPTKLPSMDLIRLQMIRDSLGLHLDATDLWEAVPYSFVVDWFLPVQTFLSQFGVKPDPSWLMASGAWSSVRYETRCETKEVITPLKHAQYDSSVEDGNRRLTGHKVTYTRTRLTSLPSEASLPTYIPAPRLPNLGQSWTGLELLLQRINRKLR